MMNHDPGKRPSAEMSLRKWREIKAGLSTSTARWRLRKPDESVGERVVLDTIAVAKQGIRSITHLFNDDVRAILYRIDTWTKISIVVADLVAAFNETHGVVDDLERPEHPFKYTHGTDELTRSSVVIPSSYRNCFHAVHRFKQQQPYK